MSRLSFIGAKPNDINPNLRSVRRGTGFIDWAANKLAGLTESKGLRSNPEYPPKNRLYPGEKHALIYNNKLKRYESGQWIGPGTNVRQRSILHENGLTPVDTAAKAHDLRYSLATNQAGIREADKKFYDRLAIIQAYKLDTPWNYNQAKLLKFKDYVPFIGSTFGDKNMTADDKQRYQSQLRTLEAHGNGKKRPLRRKR
jgi:hypothetical protein